MIDVEETRRDFQRLIEAQRRWDNKEAGGEAALRATIANMQAKIKDWEDRGEFFVSPARVLRDQVRSATALLDFTREREERGLR